MSATDRTTYVFRVSGFFDAASGLSEGDNRVTVTTDYDAGGHPGEYAEYLRECIAEWFGGCRVTTEPDEPQEPTR